MALDALPRELPQGPNVRPQALPQLRLRGGGGDGGLGGADDGHRERSGVHLWAEMGGERMSGRAALSCGVAWARGESGEAESKNNSRCRRCCCCFRCRRKRACDRPVVTSRCFRPLEQHTNPPRAPTALLRVPTCTSMSSCPTPSCSAAPPPEAPQARVPCASSTARRKPWRLRRAASSRSGAKSPVERGV